MVMSKLILNEKTSSQSNSKTNSSLSNFEMVNSTENTSKASINTETVSSIISNDRTIQLKKSESSTVLNESTINSYHYYSNDYYDKFEIKRKEVSFLTRLALYTCILFPCTGILAIFFTQKMKEHYYKSNYNKAVCYRSFGKFFAYLNIVCALIGIFVLLVLFGMI